MLTVYKAEFFDREFGHVASSVISSPEISYDYLTLETTEVILPTLVNVPFGSYANITDIDGNIIYQGIVLEAMQESGTTSVLLSPLLSICDTDVFADFTSIGNVETFIAGILNGLYAGSDTSQNITGFSATATTTTAAVMLLDGNIHNLYDFLIQAFKKYGVFCAAEFSPQDKTFTVTVAKASVTPFKIETDLPNVIDPQVFIGDLSGALNKIIYINEANEAVTATYYLHTDGTISAVDDDRITPVVGGYRYINSDDFAADAAIAATDDLTPEEFNNLIEVTVKNDDQIIAPTEKKVGDRALVYHGGAAYSSILTGYRKTTQLTTLIFGAVRLELTKKIIIERRGKK